MNRWNRLLIRWACRSAGMGRKSRISSRSSGTLNNLSIFFRETFGSVVSPLFPNRVTTDRLTDLESVVP